MAVDKKFFVDINLQGNALNNATIGSNSDMTKGGSFQYASGTGRLEYFDGENVKEVANLSDIAAVTGGLILQEGYNAATNTPNIADENADKGFFWVVTVAGSFLGTSVQVGDSIIAKVDKAGASIGDWLILQGNIVTATDEVEGIVRLATQAEVNAGTEGGAVVLTPATFENSSQIQGIRLDIKEKLDKSGGTMSGSIDMDGSSIVAAQIDDAVLGTALDANSQVITNLPDPTNDNDAARKKYVDVAASTAQSNAESFATTAADNAQAAAEATASADATAKADAAEANAKSYADSLAPNYDAAGSAATAETNAKAYADSLAPNYDAAGSAVTAETNAKAYADSLAPNYDAAGSAAQALTDANAYTDSAISQEVTDRNSAIATAKGEAISTANTYTNNQTTVKLVDTTAWVLDGGNYYAVVSHTLGNFVNFTTTINSGMVVEFAATISNNEIVLFSNTLPEYGVSVLLSKVNNNG
jgi:hypothetical protein